MSKQIEHFINHFVKELENENAVIFAGAGLSAGSGYVNWRGLLKPIADELGLDVDIEHDLVLLAQYHVNDKRNRSVLSRALIQNFSEQHKLSENHRILARLPIKTFWTTNYDTLIEDALREASKVADVKADIQQMKHAIPKRDALVYKMHGDVLHPDDAILTKDDYEQYPRTHGPFITALSGDLVSKTFLFIGFSFSDPNLDYIFNRVRLSLYGQSHDHYCIFKRVGQEEYDTEEKFNYAVVKQQHSISDLKRFGVQTLLVSSYADIPLLLRRIENRFKRRTVLISGSVHEYGDWSTEEAEVFIRDLSQALIKNGNRIVSGFGLGVGSHVITGALQEVYLNQGKRLHDQLVLRPFPQGSEAMKNWEEYRAEMVAFAGVAIFVFGNKPGGSGVVLAEGVRKEFELAKQAGVALIPIAETGYMGEVLWNEILTDFESYYPARQDLRLYFMALAKGSNRGSLIPTVLNIINHLRSN